MEAFELLSSRDHGALERYTRDLTTAALRDELEPVRCRDRETDQVVAILLRQSKNNPVLIGEAGVGKTAIVEGLAQRIVRREVPRTLAHIRLHMLSHLDLIAGTSFRGQFEKRLRDVIDQASADPDVILFVDELHNVVGAGSALGQPVDAANLLKPALSRGELRVIGATTRDEYERYVLPDTALERRFHPVEVAPLGPVETLEVLRARRPRLELHHALAITDAALEQAIASSDEASFALRDRKQPDKAIDLVDQACALERLRHPQPLPDAIAALVSERARLLAEEREAIDALLGIAAARGTPLERFSFGTYRALEAMGLGLERLVTGHVTPRRALARPDSVRRLQRSDPAGRLTAAHRDRLLLEDRLRSALLDSGLVADAEHVKRASASEPSGALKAT
jgi:ATP-dependent Clp protease ATP-binding subunit ClpA